MGLGGKDSVRNADGRGACLLGKFRVQPIRVGMGGMESCRQGMDGRAKLLFERARIIGLFVGELIRIEDWVHSPAVIREGEWSSCLGGVKMHIVRAEATLDTLDFTIAATGISIIIIAKKTTF